MQRFRDHPSGSAAGFFDRYLACLGRRHIPERQRRWYVRRIEEFIRSQRGRKLRDLTDTDIDGYFRWLGQRHRLKEWQYRQCVDAIRILFSDLVRNQAAQTVDWSYWLDSARDLGTDHATGGHRLTPEQLGYIKERRDTAVMRDTRKRHRELLVRLCTELRRRGYAYRTEQSYEQWVCRFILFCGGYPATNDAAKASRHSSNIWRYNAR